ncbi:hypothetical protein CPC16_006293, partial [Podila verticillata]
YVYDSNGEHEDEDEDEPHSYTKTVMKPLSDFILLQTINSSQGCEADVILLSLVRNRGPERQTI